MCNRNLRRRDWKVKQEELLRKTSKIRIEGPVRGGDVSFERGVDGDAGRVHVNLGIPFGDSVDSFITTNSRVTSDLIKFDCNLCNKGRVGQS